MNASSRPTLPSRFALAAVIHAGVLLVGLAWRYGGMDPIGRQWAAWALVPTPFLTLAAWREAPPDLQRKALALLLPLLGLITLVIVSALNPNMTMQTIAGRDVLRPIAHHAWLPSSMAPGTTVRNFAFVAGMLLVGINLLLARPPRSWLFRLLLVLVLNATALAIVGTVLKLTGATKILGITESPNPNFFSAFVYHNHWGAYALIAAGGAFGLCFRAERQRTEPLTMSPVPVYALLGTLLLLTLPLSTARGSTAAGAVFAIVILGFEVRRATRRGFQWGRIGAITVVVIGLLAAGGWLAERSIRGELQVSIEQLAASRAGQVGEARRVIYADTIKLIEQRPVFGWGWNTFPHAYRLVQTPMPGPETRFKRRYVTDAHSDWLEFTTEMGFVGLALWLTLAAGWVRWAGWSAFKSSPSREIAVGCAALASLAVIDFPAACPAVALSAIVYASIAAELGRTRRRSSSGTAPESATPSIA